MTAKMSRVRIRQTVSTIVIVTVIMAHVCPRLFILKNFFKVARTFTVTMIKKIVMLKVRTRLYAR